MEAGLIAAGVGDGLAVLQKDEHAGVVPERLAVNRAFTVRSGAGEGNAIEGFRAFRVDQVALIGRVDLPVQDMEAGLIFARRGDGLAAAQQDEIPVPSGSRVGVRRAVAALSGADIGDSVHGAGPALPHKRAVFADKEVAAETVEAVGQLRRPDGVVGAGLGAVGSLIARGVGRRGLHDVPVEPVALQHIREEGQLCRRSQRLAVRRPAEEAVQDRNRLGAADGLVRTEGAVRIAGHPAPLLRKRNPVRRPEALRDVGKIRRRSRGLAADACQHRHERGAGRILGRGEGRRRRPVQDAGRGQRVDGFGIPGGIGHVRKAGRTWRIVAKHIEQLRHLRPGERFFRPKGAVVEALDVGRVRDLQRVDCFLHRLSRLRARVRGRRGRGRSADAKGQQEQRQEQSHQAAGKIHAVHASKRKPLLRLQLAHAAEKRISCNHSFIIGARMRNVKSDCAGKGRKPQKRRIAEPGSSLRPDSMEGASRQR